MKNSVSINSGQTFLWKNGLCLRATEESTFLIPGAVFPKDIPIGKTLELSDTETELRFMSKPNKDSSNLPDFQVQVKKNATIKINRNTEVILVKDSNGPAAKTFIIEAGTLATEQKSE